MGIWVKQWITWITVFLMLALIAIPIAFRSQSHYIIQAIHSKQTQDVPFKGDLEVIAKKYGIHFVRYAERDHGYLIRAYTTKPRDLYIRAACLSPDDCVMRHFAADNLSLPTVTLTEQPDQGFIHYKKDRKCYYEYLRRVIQIANPEFGIWSNNCNSSYLFEHNKAYGERDILKQIVPYLLLTVSSERLKKVEANAKNWQGGRRIGNSYSTAIFYDGEYNKARASADDVRKALL